MLHNPAVQRPTADSLATYIQVALDGLPLAEARSFITKLVKEEDGVLGEEALRKLAVHVSSVILAYTGCPRKLRYFVVYWPSTQAQLFCHILAVHASSVILSYTGCPRKLSYSVVYWLSM